MKLKKLFIIEPETWGKTNELLKSKILGVEQKLKKNFDVLPPLKLLRSLYWQSKSDKIWKILKAQDLHNQALQNFNYADQHHVDKAVRELNSAKDRLTILLMQAIREVQDRA